MRKYAIGAAPVFALCFALGAAALYSQIVPTPDLAGARAGEEFRTGVQAYHRFSYNEAIRAFEAALSDRPGEAVILDWLGRAYYRSGLEETALEQWEHAAAAYTAAYGEGRDEAVLALARAETVRARRSQTAAMAEPSRYTEGARIAGIQDGTTVFRQPAAILPCPDGSSWVTAYTSNEILRIDPNGITRERSRGPPLTGFDRPYDIIRALDGRLFVSEFRGGRISALQPDGNWQAYIGAKGRGPGELIGPSSMTIDDEGYLYVVEFGNRRVSKFAPDGAFIHYFGSRDGSFDGFLAPTGIAYLDGRLFVADNLKKALYTFDTNGMYLGVFLDENLEAPESLRVWDEQTLIAADSRRLLLIDIDSAIVREAGLAGNRNVRVIDAHSDQNGNIMTANFDQNEVVMMQGVDELAAGLFVQIDRVLAADFPQVTLEVSVSDRKGRPIVGLSDRNFLLSEGQDAAFAQVAEQTLLGGFNTGEEASVILLVERSAETRAQKDGLAAAFRDIYNALQDTDIEIADIISAGRNPERERWTPGNAASFAAAARGRDESYTQTWTFDTAVRLAAGDLLPRAKKRAVIFITSGQTGGSAFDTYTITELAAFLKTGGVGFYVVTLGTERAAEELAYLARVSGGKTANLFSPAGIGAAIRSIANRPVGTYQLRYRSSLPTDFGRAFLPIEAEVYLMERSGRDRSGYFAPLE